MEEKERLKNLCAEIIESKLSAKPRMSPNAITFNLDTINSAEIEVICDLASMCHNLTIKSYKAHRISIILSFNLI